MSSPNVPNRKGIWWAKAGDPGDKEFLKYLCDSSFRWFYNTREMEERKVRLSFKEDSLAYKEYFRDEEYLLPHEFLE